MTYFTSKEISDLNNSMSAAQAVQLGTVLDELVNGFISGSSVYKVTSGSFTPTSAVSVVTTGLTSVIGAVCSLGGAPTAYHVWNSVTNGSVAGLIWVTSYQPTNASTVTPIFLPEVPAHISLRLIGLQEDYNKIKYTVIRNNGGVFF